MHSGKGLPRPDCPPSIEPVRGFLSVWLSLMLLLLAVFIVLAVDAQPNPGRAEAVRGSIIAAFGNGEGGVASGAADRRRTAAAIILALASDLRGIEAEDVFRLTRSSDLSARVTLPAQSVFDAAGEGVDAQAFHRLDRIAAAAAALPAGYRLSVVVTLPALVVARHHAPAEVTAEAAAAQAVALSSALVGRGLPADGVAIGIGADGGDGVIFDVAAEPLR